MFKILSFTIMLFISNSILSQNTEKVYIILDNDSLYKIIKNEGSATLEIPYYAYKDDWVKEKSKSTTKNNDNVVIVEPIPNKKYYRFYSIKKPVKKYAIDEIKVFSVIDVSKENKTVWNKYPYEMIFIEKIDSESYLFWHMRPEFDE